ncbi:ATP-binding protein [Myroides sp. N17-2]|uniref:tetratricopeptide repeat-containing sensor histidine kinase n=1 Tax=Myroides sp. N17-2 TaxID=2030799 RepID=UPI000EFB2AA2|nr:ATP-binding protein [Myroides sp. N17-2]
MFRRFLLYSLICISFLRCSKKVDNQIDINDNEKAIEYKSFSLNDSLYKSEHNRLTKHILTFGHTLNTNSEVVFFKENVNSRSLRQRYSNALQNKDTIGLAHASFRLGEYYQYNIVADSSYLYYNRATQYFNHLRDTLKLQQTYLYLSILLSDNKVYPEAEIQIKNAIALNSKKENVYKLYSQKYVLAGAELGLEKYDKAIRLFQEANELLKSKEIEAYFNAYQISLNRISIKNYLAKIYIYRKEYSEAEAMLNLALEELANVREVDKNLFYPLILHKFAKVKLASDDYKSVLNLIQQSKSINTAFNNHYSINNDNLVYAEYFFKQRAIAAGVYVLGGVLDSARKNNDLDTQRKALELLVIYDKANSKENFAAYRKINSVISNEMNMVRSKFARLKYESDSLIHSNKVLKDQNDLIVIVSILLILLFLGVLIVVFFRNKAKEISMIQMYQKDTERYYDSIIHIQNRITKAQELERKKFAKELHDGVLNKLFVTRFSLLQLERDNLELTKEVLANEVKEVESFIRNSSHTLYNDEKFLVGDYKQLIEELVTMQNRNVTTTFTYTIDPKLDLEVLTHRVKVNIYRILQEVFQNVQKYAEAKECILEFQYVSESVFKVKVLDTGKGFNVKTVNRGLGLKNIEDRLYLLGSKLVLRSRKGIGTSITFEITFN